jgi:hypothetical protein
MHLQIKSFQQFLVTMQPFVEEHGRCYVFWLGFMRPVLTLVHPDTAKVILRSLEPKAKGGAGYEFLLPWLGEYGLLHMQFTFHRSPFHIRQQSSNSDAGW